MHDGDTLTQYSLELSGTQLLGHLEGVKVGGTVVKPAPSASCLQMYPNMLVQGSTSQTPANTPVVMATHPLR